MTYHRPNPSHLTQAAKHRATKPITNLSPWQPAIQEITTWPEYQPTPTWILENHANSLDIGKIYYNDESSRFARANLNSFKALGAPYAVFRLLADTVEREVGVRPASTDLRTDKYRRYTESVTVCVATDGNQGRGLAYGAQIFGCRCVVYIHNHVSPERKRQIESLGAIVIRVSGEYEMSVQRAWEDARCNGWYFVSSTSWDDFGSGVPRMVMNGYMVMVEEVLCAIEETDLSGVSHVLMCGGVGSIAAAVSMGLMQRFREFGDGDGHRTPRFIVIEPEEADCLYQSSLHGTPTPSRGSLRTVMAGLACREVSPAAYKILEWLASDFVIVSDGVAVDGMKALAYGHGDVPIICGESSGASMGLLLEASRNLSLRSALGLTSTSHVVMFGCEGATDPFLYEDIVGVGVDQVLERQEEYLSGRG